MKLEKNMGGADRIIRTALATGMIAAYSTGKFKGIAGISLLVLSGIFMITSAASSCPVYEALGIDSLNKIDGEKENSTGNNPI